MQLILVILNYLDLETHQIKVGGVETYIHDLANVGVENGYSTTIVQIVPEKTDSYEADFSGVKVRLFPKRKNLLLSDNQATFNAIFKEYNSADSIFVIATDQMDISSEAENVIQIQHGVAFDIPGDMITGFFGKNKFLISINKHLRCIKNVHRIAHAKHTVCVDYNFYNWYRTLGTFSPQDRVTVIPNYASSKISQEELIQKMRSRPQTKRIVFARRFVDYRGTILFANVVERLLREGFEFSVCFAGSGPLKKELETRFKTENRVVFAQFKAVESIRFHYDFDIAVVPTIFSEGTSLSLCEAMSAGCFPIATHVGGMTNMLIDRFNGRFAAPTEDSVYDVMKEVLDMDGSDFEQIVNNAYLTSTLSFSKDVWKQNWLNVFNRISYK